MFTVAKREFLTALGELILRPRQLDYRVQFPGPGGANAVEAALKLARKVTGRTEVITFVLALPLIGLPPRALACLAIVIALAVPVVNLALGNHVSLQQDPTFGSVVHPYYLAGGLLFNGEYPALPLMAFICTGMAIGRLRLSSARVAAGLLGSGVALALAAWFTSGVLLLHMDGLRGLRGLRAAGAVADGLPPGQVHDYLLWQPDNVASWWWLAVRAPYTSTPIDLLHTMGVAVAVLGGMLLLSRVAGPVLKPLAALGSMTLTIYCTHLVYVSFDPLANDPLLSYAVQVSAALIFAVIWRRFRGQGPLEKLIAIVAGHARRAVAAAPGRPVPARPVPSRPG